ARTNAKGIISIRQVDGDRQLQELAGNEGGAADMAFSPNGALLAVRYRRQIPGQAANFQLWDWAQGKVVFQPSFAVSLNSFGFSVDGRLLALGQEDGTITIYDPAKAKETTPLSVGVTPKHLAFSPDGVRLAVCCHGDVQVREVVGGNLVCKLSHESRVNRVVWHPDGNLLGAACMDFNVYLSDSVSGQRHTVLRGHSGAVMGLAFTPSGATLLSADYDGTCRLW